MEHLPGAVTRAPVIFFSITLPPSIGFSRSLYLSRTSRSASKTLRKVLNPVLEFRREFLRADSSSVVHTFLFSDREMAGRHTAAAKAMSVKGLRVVWRKAVCMHTV